MISRCRFLQVNGWRVALPWSPLRSTTMTPLYVNLYSEISIHLNVCGFMKLRFPAVWTLLSYICNVIHLSFACLPPISDAYPPYCKMKKHGLLVLLRIVVINSTLVLSLLMRCSRIIVLTISWLITNMAEMDQLAWHFLLVTFFISYVHQVSPAGLLNKV